MEGQGHQELVALNVQLGPSKLLLEMLPVLLVQLVKALQLHSQHVQLVYQMSTVQMQGIHVLLVLQLVKQQIQLLGRLNVVRHWADLYPSNKQQILHPFELNKQF